MQRLKTKEYNEFNVKNLEKLSDDDIGPNLYSEPSVIPDFLEQLNKQKAYKIFKQTLQKAKTESSYNL